MNATGRYATHLGVGVGSSRLAWPPELLEQYDSAGILPGRGIGLDFSKSVSAKGSAGFLRRNGQFAAVRRRGRARSTGAIFGVTGALKSMHCTRPTSRPT
jgi:hypothetical protein